MSQRGALLRGILTARFRSFPRPSSPRSQVPLGWGKTIIYSLLPLFLLLGVAELLHVVATREKVPIISTRPMIANRPADEVFFDHCHVDALGCYQIGIGLVDFLEAHWAEVSGASTTSEDETQYGTR